jgi:hypothetical protein
LVEIFGAVVIPPSGHRTVSLGCSPSRQIVVSEAYVLIDCCWILTILPTFLS